eukprot:scaffold3107_cov176-Ochromonas_danica.AAC.6
MKDEQNKDRLLQVVCQYSPPEQRVGQGQKDLMGERHVVEQISRRVGHCEVVQENYLAGPKSPFLSHLFKSLWPMGMCGVRSGGAPT